MSRAILALCLGLAGTGCGMFGSTPPSGGGQAPGQASGQASGQAGGAGHGADNAPQYVIGPGDVLSVFVYQSPALSTNSLPVRPDGRISVPLVADIQAAGKTPTELGHDIAEQLKKYVQEPNVTVMVHAFEGPADRQVRVIGAASEPRAIPYRQNMSVLDVMIATGGLTKFAAGNRAKIVRATSKGQQELTVRLDDLLKDGDISQNVAMQPGDILLIPESRF